MKTILFVCQANVGRSQMAEGYFNSHGLNIRAISGGVSDVSKKYNGHPDLLIAKLMQEDGVDISHQRIKLVTQEMIDMADSVVVLCKPSNIPSKFIDTQKFIFHEVEDPFEKGEAATRIVRDRIKAYVDGLILKMNQ